MKLFLVLTLCLVVAGCVRDDLVACDDGTACPAETVCHPMGCLAPAQLAVCAEAADLAACTTDRIDDGVCFEGACFAVGCGNGVTETTEACDDGNRLDRDGCAANCLSTEVCGNGFLDTLTGELCDDGNLTSGDGCQSDCALPRCGDGVIDAVRNELCDDGSANSDTTPDRCRVDCRPARCGDGVKDTARGEQCDDGNTDNADGCRNDCVSPSCGNSIVDAGEECDDGNGFSNDGCQYNCKLPRCGDGIKDTALNEVCDAGMDNANTPDAPCRLDCRATRCGDGVIDPSYGEVCDDTNTTLGDGCRPDCTVEVCGDGILDSRAGEECDDGNLVATDDCRNTCLRPRCGDGIVDASLFEECDAGAANSLAPNAACRTNCRSATCGDGVRDTATEQCDDTNRLAGDGCSPSCTTEVCGNAIVDPLEQCDDGNASNADACHTDCKVPRCGDTIKDMLLGEECDLGAANSSAPNATCRPTCRLKACGDGVIDAPTENCDDNNRTAGDGCSPSCRTEVCGNGIVDPSEQCDDGNMLNTDACHTDCKVPRCGDAIIDALLSEECDTGTANANTSGACRTTCRLPRCGDNIRDTSNEVCDDGNSQAGDGCSPDCRSDETCGNGTLDLAKGEECDDHSLLNHDGCSSQCLNEFARWDDVTPQVLTPRSRHAAVYDAARQRLVVFGGAPPAAMVGPTFLLNDTWEYDGRGWLQRHPTIAPSARMDHALAYDAKRGLVYLFGGVTGNGTRLNDLWVWDGIVWTQVFVTGLTPPSRSEAAVAYDPRADEIVVFGGRTATAYLDDTWTFHAGAWTQRMPVASPVGRSGAGAAYDPAIPGIVIHGGENAGGTLGDTWLYRDAKWESRGSGPIVAGTGMTWDPVGGKLLIFAGTKDGQQTNKTFEFTGSGWAERAMTNLPAVRTHATLTAMFDAGLVVAIGGTIDATVTGETWLLKTPEWRAASAETGPSARAGAGVAYDAARATTVMFGGNGRETWEWTGASWRNATAGLAPDAVYRPAMVFAPGQGVLLVGGSSTSSCTTGDLVNETWAWKDGQWAQLNTSGPKQCLPTLAYHATAGVAVLIGGYDGNGHNDALQWDGAAWSPRPDLSTPTYASGRALAYDHASDELWSVGEWENAFDELKGVWWRWKGSWSEYDAEIKPPPRKHNATVYDPNRAAITVFGGEGIAGPLDDVWVDAFGKWKQVPAGMPVSYGSEAPAIVYHAATASFVAVSAPAGSTGSTYSMRYESRTHDEACLEGIDRDGDGLSGLEDPDCWVNANALCPPCPYGTSCTCTGQTCGDSTCSPLEDFRTCPTDCPDPGPRCGDYHCDAGETCPGDC